MSAEKSGFNITVTCSQDPTINFACRAKKRPGIKLGEKIDMTTDASIGSKEFEPGNLFEITDGQLTVLDDPENAAKIIANDISLRLGAYFHSLQTKRGNPDEY